MNSGIQIFVQEFVLLNRFAIYIPLFLPIGLPILGSLFKAIKWIKTKRKQKPKTEWFIYFPDLHTCMKFFHSNTFIFIYMCYFCKCSEQVWFLFTWKCSCIHLIHTCIPFIPCYTYWYWTEKNSSSSTKHNQVQSNFVISS